MGQIFVVMEHKMGELNEISLQLLWKGAALCETLSHTLTAVIMADESPTFLSEIEDRADRIILIEDSRLKTFDGDAYKEILGALIDKHHPFITIMGHTPWGMDFAPPLSVKTGLPVATDCVDILVEEGQPKAIRQIYSGKLLSRVALEASEGYLFTVRPGSFPPDRLGERKAEIIRIEPPTDLTNPRKAFQEYEDAGAGDVDISQADFLVSIGRGVGEEGNVDKMKELATLLGGVLSCSRPVVDKNWLPKYHQVGTSGKSVKPKVYFALGISGSFQHMAGVSGADTIIAVNKDRRAPIFRAADYGVVEDLFKISDALKEKLSE
jgi:electron transfer flavoprotein alpha subunit